ncbi:signal-transducing adaptor protein 1-like isoform X2 [Petromyzon marinus]|uniref:Signal-transducing adaptor protein 1-like isoform X2 n=1 Tax=Petromyzon marinus TaxID=7757 RepID=A0AAJ7SQA2_PETMA|nr:signal-transducing adaptor protein 1-like isoform X2 [Petromyzon marinus]
MAECSAAGKLSLSLRVHNDGYLHVKNRKDKEYKKQWTVLNGDVLNFYSDKHDKYGEKIYLKSPLTLTTKYLTKIGSSTAKMTLKTGTTEVKLRADTMDCMELWRVFMLAVTELKVPEKSRLPLEHLHRVHKAIATEKRARLADPESQLSFSGPGPETPSHSLPPLPVPKPQLPQQSPLVRPTECATSAETDGANIYSEDLLYPRCFYKVDRVEAEKMLQEHPELGNLLIRPATNNEDYSVSVCHWQPLNRPHRPQHYKVTHKNDRYIIELTKKVEVNSLQGVVDHFVKATNGMLTPYVQQAENVIYEDALESEVYMELFVGAESEPNSTGEQLSANKLKPVLPPDMLPTDRASPSSSSANANKMKPALPPERVSTNIAALPSPSTKNANYRKSLLPSKRFSTKTAPSPSPSSENADQWTSVLPQKNVSTMTTLSPSPTPENDDNWLPMLPPKGVSTIKEVLPSPGNGMDELKRAIELRRLQLEGEYE